MSKIFEVVVLGASGFVGRNLIKFLKNFDQYNVIALSKPDFDLCDPDSFNLIPNSVDVIVHSAGIVGSNESEKTYWDTNVLSAYSLAKYLKTKGMAPQIIYLSTGAVYGSTDQALRVTDEIKPENLYGMSKYCAEEILRCYSPSRLAIIRLFFPYGPGQSDDRFLPKLCRTIATGNHVMLNQEDRPLVNPIFIDDLVLKIENIISNNFTGIINIGGSQVISIRGIAEKIAGLLGVQAQFTVCDTKVLNMYCDTALQIHSVDLDSGLRLMVKSLDL